MFLCNLCCNTRKLGDESFHFMKDPGHYDSTLQGIGNLSPKARRFPKGRDFAPLGPWEISRASGEVSPDTSLTSALYGYNILLHLQINMCFNCQLVSSDIWQCAVPTTTERFRSELNSDLITIGNVDLFLNIISINILSYWSSISYFEQRCKMSRLKIFSPHKKLAFFRGLLTVK